MTRINIDEDPVTALRRIDGQFGLPRFRSAADVQAWAAAIDNATTIAAKMDAIKQMLMQLAVREAMIQVRILGLED
jgi:hypothetical protein